LLKTVTVKGLMNVEDDKIETFSVLWTKINAQFQEGPKEN
jgi:hypothetical protein